MVFLIEKNNNTVKKAKHSTSMGPLPVLACQFFKINLLHTSKTPFFRAVDLILIVKSDIMIIVINTDKKISYFLFKIYKKLEKLTHFMPALWTETYKF